MLVNFGISELLGSVACFVPLGMWKRIIYSIQLQYTTQCILCSEKCTVHCMQYTIYGIQNAQCIVYSTQYTVYNTQYIQYSVYSLV